MKILSDTASDGATDNHKPYLLSAGVPPLLLSARTTAEPDDSISIDRQTNSETRTNFSASFLSDHTFCYCRQLKPKRKFCAYCRLVKLHKQLIARKKMSKEAGDSLFSVLGLMPDKMSLSIEQARFMRHLLEHLVARCPLIKQKDVTSDTLEVWLENNLPNNLKNNLIIAKTFTVEADKPGNKTKQTANNAASKPSKKSRPKRRAVTAATFNQVAVRQGSFCYWCGIKVMCERQIPADNRLLKNSATIIYLSGEELCEEAIGTIDHLVRVADGGNNDPSNLVISCVACNRERENVTQRYNRPFARRRVPCRNCGGRFFHPDWGCCSICGAGPSRIGELSKLKEKLILTAQAIFGELKNFFN